MIQSEGFTVIDGTSGIEEQQQLVRNRVNKVLSPKQLEPKTISQRKNYVGHLAPEQTKKQQQRR
jgi:hypothetical protein